MLSGGFDRSCYFNNSRTRAYALLSQAVFMLTLVDRVIFVHGRPYSTLKASLVSFA